MKLRSISKFRSHSSTRLSPGVDPQVESTFTRVHIMFYAILFMISFQYKTYAVSFCASRLQHCSSRYRVGIETKLIIELADIPNEFLFPLEVRNISIPLYERDDSKCHSRCFQKDELSAKGETGLSYFCCQMLFKFRYFCLKYKLTKNLSNYKTQSKLTTSCSLGF